jgi:DNA processing protein
VICKYFGGCEIVYDEYMKWQESEWAEELKDIRPKLKAINYEGDIGLLSDGVVRLAVVGSRRMSGYGASVVKSLVSGVVERGILIVSGFMYGVDQMAHNECLKAGGKTIAVLGWGLGRQLGIQDARLRERILAEGGLILSEYEDDFEAQRWSFPVRNRIVAGISRATLVVEASRGSGSLITADWAGKYGRPVLAVPGMVTSSLSQGTNDLIAEGKAQAVGEAKDVLKCLGVEVGVGVEKVEDDEMMKLLRVEPRTVDEIVRCLGWSVSRVVSVINERLISGSIREEAGRYFVQ